MAHFYKLLIVEPDESAWARWRALLADHRLVLARNGVEALKLMRSTRFHATVAHQELPGLPGLSYLRHAARRQSGCARLLFTSWHELSDLIRVVKPGEVDRFLSPRTAGRDLRGHILSAATQARLATDAA